MVKPQITHESRRNLREPVVCVRLASADEAARIDEAAAALGMTRGQWVRMVTMERLYQKGFTR